MKKTLLAFLTLFALLGNSFALTYAQDANSNEEVISWYTFEKEGLLGLKADKLEDESIIEQLGLDPSKTYYLTTLAIRQNDRGIQSIKATIPLPKEFTIAEPQDKTIVDGDYFTNLVGKNYDANTGYLTYEATTDQPNKDTSSEITDVVGFIMQLKDGNTATNSTFTIMGAGEGQTADIVLGAVQPVGVNLFEGKITLNINNLPVAQDAPAAEPKKEEPKKEAPTVIKKEETKTETVEVPVDKVETGVNETIALMLLAVVSLSGFAVLRKKA